ncbi:hypothetical protein K353_02897 [Kitasatospora sp. SolWspMP-SS2h]|uniref:hypothetical protein n=1 Tax=Kitasatospora sp. SolWspMP-SS2h TaxID=1305729 RepID=UPI000DBA7E73|nr:hypothetical protein [Kitasatospora sp. SolWspMP-SS2h]RAJ41786.1 hypothetical protein K353_02897 [Kitasatospora sp. SolWspMP-SS2h]
MASYQVRLTAVTAGMSAFCAAFAAVHHFWLAGLGPGRAWIAWAAVLAAAAGFLALAVPAVRWAEGTRRGRRR